MVQLSVLDIILAIMTMVSFFINIYQFNSRLQLRSQGVGIYSQLWDIVHEIESGDLKSPDEMKRLVNQVRLATIPLNMNLGGKGEVYRPWDWGIEARRHRHRRDIDWKKEITALEKELANARQLATAAVGETSEDK